MRYKGTDKTLPQIARELDVDGIVEGTVQRFGDRVQINAQLIYGPTDRHIWAMGFERDVKDMLQLQGTIASEIAHEIQVKLTPAERRGSGMCQPGKSKGTGCLCGGTLPDR